MIKQVQILKVVTYGFKGYEQQYTFLFNGVGKNIIIGDNGDGKSSIGEAIAWAFTGKNIEGNTKELNIINNKGKVACVTVTFLDEMGFEHELQRKANSSVTIKFDGTTVTQEKLKNIINTDVFLAIFNPLYAANLSNAKATVLSLLPQLTKEDVFSRMPEENRKVIESQDFNILNTNDYLKSQRKTLAEISDKKKYLTGYMSKLSEPFEIPERIEFDNTKIAELEKLIEELSSRRAPILDLNSLLLKKSELDKKILEIRNEKFESEKLILELNNKKKLLKQELKMEEEREFKSSQNTSSLEKEVDTLKNSYIKVDAEKRRLEDDERKLEAKKISFKTGDICPFCKQHISEHSVEKMNAELQSEVKSGKAAISTQKNEKKTTLEQLQKDVAGLMKKITTAKEMEDRERAAFNKNKADKISEINTKINEIKAQLENFDVLEKNFYAEKEKQVVPLTEEIEKLNLTKLNNKNNEIQRVFDEKVRREKKVLQQQLLTLRQEKEISISKNADRNNLIEQNEKNRQELKAKRLEFSELEKQEVVINTLITSMKCFNAQKANRINETVSKHLDNVSLKLEKLVETTGETKDAFDILYCNKELKICSTSEVIKAGLELSKMISQLSGCSFPVFVDNGESITRYKENAIQTLETRVVGNARLSLLLPNGTAEQIKVEATVKK